MLPIREIAVFSLSGTVEQALRPLSKSGQSRLFALGGPDLPISRASKRGGDLSSGVLHRLSVGSDLAASEPLQLYLDPGEILSAIVRRSGTTGAASADVNFSGYLVDAP